jgi:chemotaxis protein methyltransferase CheR
VTAGTPWLAPLLARLRERAGLEFPGDRDAYLAAAVARAAEAAGGLGADAYAAAVLRGDADLQPLVEEVTVGETYFFRDPAQWAFVERVVLRGALARRDRDRDRVLFRAWSAGCASGEEPYTLAMLLADAGLSGRFDVVGTDISEVALARARRADYSLWSLRGDAGTRARRHLSLVDGRFRLHPAIAAQVRFARLNLAEPGWPSPSRGIADLDLVLCRNVLIYLAAEHVAAVAARLFQALAPGGWLLAGASDPALARHAPFEVVAGEHGVAYRRPVNEEALPAKGRRVLRSVARVGTSTPTPTPTPTPTSTSTANLRTIRHRPISPPPKRPPPPPEDLDCARCRALLDAGHLAEAHSDIDRAIARAPLRPALHLTRALVMAELGRLDEAEASARRALYLDRSQPFLHHFLALLRLQRGDATAAARGFGTVEAMCERRAPGDPVPLSEGMTSAGLAAAARFHRQRLAGPFAGGSKA